MFNFWPFPAKKQKLKKKTLNWPTDLTNIKLKYLLFYCQLNYFL